MNEKTKSLQEEKRRLVDWLALVNNQNPRYDDGFLKEWIKNEIYKIDEKIKE